MSPVSSLRKLNIIQIGSQKAWIIIFKKIILFIYSFVISQFLVINIEYFYIAKIDIMLIFVWFVKNPYLL
jgi:hypothetical protein